MLGRRKILGILGMLTMLAGMLLFLVGKSFDAGVARWFFGPLLWFVGCALLISWALSATYRSEVENDEAIGAPREQKPRTEAQAVRKVS